MEQQAMWLRGGHRLRQWDSLPPFDAYRNPDHLTILREKLTPMMAGAPDSVTFTWIAPHISSSVQPGIQMIQ